MSSGLHVLRAARRLVAAGWCQKKWDQHHHDGSCYCAAGAMGYGSSIDDGDNPDMEAALFAFYKHGVLGSPDGKVVVAGDVLTQVTDWNDRKGRTQADVVAAFDRAIAALEAAS